MDLSRSPDLYLNEKARLIAPVRMVGTYGSEMLLHAVMFKAKSRLQGCSKTICCPRSKERNRHTMRAVVCTR